MGSQLKILIIDDEEDLCFLLSSSLRKKIQDTKYAFNLITGLEEFKTHKPGWLILDNNLPDGSGWENASLFYDIHPDVKIIGISANPDSLKKSMANNLDYTLVKPVRTEDIFNIIFPKS